MIVGTANVDILGSALRTRMYGPDSASGKAIRALQLAATGPGTSAGQAMSRMMASYRTASMTGMTIAKPVTVAVNQAALNAMQSAMPPIRSEWFAGAASPLAPLLNRQSKIAADLLARLEVTGWASKFDSFDWARLLECVGEIEAEGPEHVTASGEAALIGSPARSELLRRLVAAMAKDARDHPLSVFLATLAILIALYQSQFAGDATPPVVRPTPVVVCPAPPQHGAVGRTTPSDTPPR